MTTPPPWGDLDAVRERIERNVREYAVPYPVPYALPQNLTLACAALAIADDAYRTGRADALDEAASTIANAVERRSGAEAERDALRDAVLAIHRLRPGDEGDPEGQCAGCLAVDPGGWAVWPCPTALAVGATPPTTTEEPTP